MTSAARVIQIEEVDEQAFEKIKRAMEAPTSLLEWDSHVLSAAIEKIFGLRAVRGYYRNRNFLHSWNALRDGFILDSRPIAVVRGGPVIIDPREYRLMVTSPYSTMGRIDTETAYGEMLRSKEFKKAVALAIQEFRTATR